MINRNHAQKILEFLEEATAAFSTFQKKSQLHCPPGCGQCCFKADLVCNPMELLPLAFYLMDKGIASEVLEKARMNSGKPCVLLAVNDFSKGLGQCGHYLYRPFVCRAFGVAGRTTKDATIELSVCKKLKEDSHYKSSEFALNTKAEVPLIEVYKKRLEALDPELATKEVPINEALAVILEKVLLWQSYNV